MSIEIAASTKRSHPDDADVGQSPKRQKANDDGQPSDRKLSEETDQLQSVAHAHDSAIDVAVSQTAKGETEGTVTRRKNGQLDEKQRSRRLFGSLLGTLGQGADRTVKRRQEIENRRKAELRQQDDAHAEDLNRDVAQMKHKRKQDQWSVDEEDMRIRHRAVRNMANFLQTRSLPRLYYRPWDLRSSEKRKIEEQCKSVEDRIDDEEEEFESRRNRSNESNGHVNGYKQEGSLDDHSDDQEHASQDDGKPEAPSKENGQIPIEDTSHNMPKATNDAAATPKTLREASEDDKPEPEPEDARVDGEEDAVLY